jgi:hypothetical protein
MIRKKFAPKIEWDCIYDKQTLLNQNKDPKEGDIVDEKKIEKIEDKGNYYLIKWYDE